MLLSDPVSSLKLGIGASIIAFLPSGLVLLLVVRKRLMQSADDLRCGFEHRAQLRLIDALDICSQVSAKLLETFAHVPRVRGWITGLLVFHDFLRYGLPQGSGRLPLEPDS